jgi:hypothetical protein
MTPPPHAEAQYSSLGKPLPGQDADKYRWNLAFVYEELAWAMFFCGKNDPSPDDKRAFDNWFDSVSDRRSLRAMFRRDRARWRADLEAEEEAERVAAANTAQSQIK